MYGLANPQSYPLQAVLFWFGGDPLYLDDGPSAKLFMDLLRKMGVFLSPINTRAEKNLGGAPPEFLPQMLLEENPVRLFPSRNLSTAG